MALYAQGPEFFPELPVFESGARLLIEAFLQSPYFLYRVEAGATAVNGLIPLDAYEVAARLSYTLWDTMPDDELFQAASASALATREQVALQARRLLESERAAEVLGSFHRQLFRTERYQGIANEPEGLADMAEEEHRLFVKHVVFDAAGSLKDLLTTNQTFVNSTLAELYGVPGNFTDQFELTELDPSERAGFLTQVGFLASNANSGIPDPIHRGIFLSRDLACLSIPVPPGDIPPLPNAAGRTNRETVESHTETPGSVCASCHGTFINPFGFPFEYYDGLGRYRTLDNGQPVNGAATVKLGLETVEVNNGVELVAALSESQAVHDCYAGHWLEFAMGRNTVRTDQNLITRVAKASKENNVAIKEILVELISSPAFLNRSTQEFGAEEVQ
jgi:hypothetical protein